MSNSVLDVLGREIRPGDTVVYPVRGGSHMSLEHGVVEAIIEQPCFDGQPATRPALRLTKQRHRWVRGGQDDQGNWVSGYHETYRGTVFISSLDRVAVVVR